MNTDPIFFTVSRVAVIDNHRLGVQGAFSNTTFLVEFCDRDIEDPNSDPIGVYYYNGSRRFIWKDRFWSEVNIDRNVLLHNLALSKYRPNDELLRELLQKYSVTYREIINRSEGNISTFCRAIYRVY